MIMLNAMINNVLGQENVVTNANKRVFSAKLNKNLAKKWLERD